MGGFRSLMMAVIGLCCVGSHTATAADDVLGVGSTFVYPVLSRWATAYKAATGMTINYQPVGSAAGIRQIKGRTVDFGASDAPLRPEELAGTGLVQFPIVVGAVVPVVNLAGIAPGQLRLTGLVLANIYLGKITKWNDRAISDLNPGTALPDQAIIPIHRSDGSGTTFVFTDYLARVSTEWRGRIGVSTAVEFPGGIGGKGNEGVAAFTSQTKGTIAYVEYAYTIQSHLAYVLLQNRDGEFVAPNKRTFQAAAASADWAGAPGFYVLLGNQPGTQSWPITGATFVLLHKEQQKPLVAGELFNFFDWAYRHGSELADDLDYVAMPEPVVDLVEATWSAVRDPDGKPAWPAPATVQH